MPETFQRILYKTSQELHKLYWLCIKKRGVVCALKNNKHILCIFEKKRYSNYNIFHNTKIFERLKKLTKQYVRKVIEKLMAGKQLIVITYFH